MAHPSEFWCVIARGRTLPGVICVVNVDFLYVSTISDSYVNRTTWIQCIVKDSVDSLIRMNLKPTASIVKILKKYDSYTRCYSESCNSTSNTNCYTNCYIITLYTKHKWQKKNSLMWFGAYNYIRGVTQRWKAIYYKVTNVIRDTRSYPMKDYHFLFVVVSPERLPRMSNKGCHKDSSSPAKRSSVFLQRGSQSVFLSDKLTA